MFWGADSESDIENLEFEKKIDRTGHLNFLELQWGTKTSGLENFNQKVVILTRKVQMTRGFQIWPQNLN